MSIEKKMPREVDEDADFTIINPTMANNDTLSVGKRLYSANKAYFAELCSDGILRYYLSMESVSTPYELWSSPNSPQEDDYRLRMQKDGNLVIYHWDEKKEGTVAWASNTDGHLGCILMVSNTGKFSIINSDGKDLKIFKKEYMPEAFYQGKKISDKRSVSLPGQLSFVKGLSTTVAGLAKPPFNKIGVAAINAIFSGSNHPSTNELRNDFKEMILNAFFEKDVEDADIDTNTIIDILNSETFANKSEEEQIEALEEYINGLNTNIEILKKDYGKMDPSDQLQYLLITILIKTINLKISMQQQLSIFDNPENPNESFCARDLSRQLSPLVEWLEGPSSRFLGQANDHYTEHSSKISNVTQKHDHSGVYNNISDNYWWVFSDKDNGYSYESALSRKQKEINANKVTADATHAKYLQIIEYRKYCDTQLHLTIEDSRNDWNHIISNVPLDTVAKFGSNQDNALKL